MEHESPARKAFREFALADPNNCDREWEACLALVKKTGSAPVSSPTSSTSPLHCRARATTAAVTDPSATHSTAPLRAPSGAASSDCFREPYPRSTATLAASASRNLTKDDLSPGARRIYDYIVGATDNFDEPAAATSSPTCTPAISATRSTATSICAVTSTTTPVAAVSTTTSAVASASTTTCISSVVHDAADDQVAPSPTTCSSECPSKNVPASVSVTIGGGGVSESCCLEPEPVAVTATVEIDPCSVTSTKCSMIFLGGDTSMAAPIPAYTSSKLSDSMVNTGDASSCSAQKTITGSILVRDLDAGNIRVTAVAHINDGIFSVVSAPAEDTRCNMMFWFLVLETRPLPWPSFVCDQAWIQLWCVSVHEKMSGFISKLMRITSGDDTNTLNQSANNLLDAAPNIPDDALVHRVSLSLLESIVKLVMSRRKFRAAVQMQFHGPLHEAQVYWTRLEIELVIVSSLPILRSYWLTSDHHHWVLKPLQFYQPLVSWFQVWSAGKAFWYGYDAAQFQWEIAWPATTHAHSASYGMRLYFILKCYTVMCSMEIEIRSLSICPVFVLHLHWDPGGFTQHVLRVKEEFWNIQSYTAILIHGQYSFNHTSHQSERIKAVKPKPPWPRLVGNSIHEPKPPWFVPTIPNSGFKVNLMIVSGSITSWELKLFGVAASHGSRTYGCLDFEWKSTGLISLMGLSSICDHYVTEGTTYLCSPPAVTSALLKMQPVGDHCKVCAIFLFSWDMTATLDSVQAIQYSSGMFSFALQQLKAGDYFEAAILLLRSPLSQEDDSLTCTERFLFSWDPGVYSASLWCQGNPGRMDDVCSCPGIDKFQVPWDPGGSSRDRLEGKPNFKEGGLSATSLLGWPVGRYSWAMACSEARPGGDIYWDETYWRGRLGTERMASAGRRG